MKTITLTPTGEQKFFHEYYSPFIMASDVDMPKMHNRGYNTYGFNEAVTVNYSNMPIQSCEKVTPRMIKEHSDILIYRKDGSTCSAIFTRTIFDGVVTDKGR